ncbi:MAG: glycosyltransferase family 9 protein [Candidatus Omnitrophica bacterium]|nr:glycosyltransferase family 9 protein [Candidatus Omnitrophota bacterium]
MTTPILQTLRKAYPDARIYLLANKFASDLLKGAYFVDKIYTIRFPWSTYDYSWGNLRSIYSVVRSLRKENIDLAIDAKIDARNAFLMFLIGAKRRLGYDITGGGSFLTDTPDFPANSENMTEIRLSLLKHLGIEISDKAPVIPLSKEDMTVAENFLESRHLNRNNLVGIHPGASYKARIWLPENLAVVIRGLKKEGVDVILIKGPKDERIVTQIQGMLKEPIEIFEGTLKGVTALLCYCRLLICMDSAILQLSAATKTPTLAIYGSTSPLRTKPLTSNIVISYHKEFDCQPCDYNKPFCTDKKCMSAITPEEVLRKARQMLRSN